MNVRERQRQRQRERECMYIVNTLIQRMQPKISEHIACWKEAANVAEMYGNYSFSHSDYTKSGWLVRLASQHTEKWKIYLNSFFPSVQAQSPEIICTSCTIVVLLALYSYSYQEHTIHFRFTLILIFYYFIILFCLLVVRIRCGAFSVCVCVIVGLIVDFILLHLVWKNGDHK